MLQIQDINGLDLKKFSSKVGLCIQDFWHFVCLVLLLVCCWLDFCLLRQSLWRVWQTLASPHVKAEGAQMVCEEAQCAGKSMHSGFKISKFVIKNEMKKKTLKN